MQIDKINRMKKPGIVTSSAVQHLIECSIDIHRLGEV